jgi:large subunit ribosomal protein L25
MAETFIFASFAVLTSGLMCIIETPGAYFNTIKRTVKYLCPADIVPPYIEVDLSELDVGQKLLMRDLKVHPALKLLQSPDQPICNIIGSRAPEQKKGK